MSTEIQPTPETDAVFAKQNGQLCGGANLDFARKLERERDEAREQLEAMREAIGVAHEALRACSFNIGSRYGKLADDADEALDKLQPFLKP